MTNILRCYENPVRSILNHITMRSEQEPLNRAQQPQNKRQKAFVGIIIALLATAFLMIIAVIIALAVAESSVNDAINNELRPELQKVNNELQELQKVNNELRQGLQEKYTTYERLGHYECPEVNGTTKLIYEGFTAGFTTQDGSTTYKCLPTSRDDIDYYDDDDSKFTSAPVEVRYVNRTVYSTFKDSKNFKNVPCAVCSVTGRNKIQVFPATYECKGSWTLEYCGYLMTDYSATTLTCVDKNMETFSNNPPASSSAPTLNHVVVGPIPSIQASYEHYKPNNVLSCAVCSK